MPMLRGSHREILAAMKGNDAVGLARLAHYFLPNPGKPGFGGGEGGERSEPGGGTTLAPCLRPPPTPDPSPPLASLAGGGERRRMHRSSARHRVALAQPGWSALDRLDAAQRRRHRRLAEDRLAIRRG